MRKSATLIFLAILFSAVIPSFAQTSSDADRIIMRLRPVCNGGQGSYVVVAFDIKQRAGAAGGYVGGYIMTITYSPSSKFTGPPSRQRRYANGIFTSFFTDESFGSGAWFNQHAGGAPLNSTYFSPSTDCAGNPLGDGYFEIMRYTFQVSPSANGTVSFSMYNYLTYRAGIAFQQGYQASAVYYSNKLNNSNDSMLVINNMVIPVELSSLSADAQVDRSVLLTWRTESETANMGFEIERGDGANFERIGYVEGHGTTSAANEYSFRDPAPRPAEGTDVVFYRLKQIDTDGTANYSHIVSTRILPETVGIDQNFPNPVEIGGPTTVPFTLAVPAQAKMEIFNALGQRMATLVDGPHSAGRHLAVWDGRDAAGNIAPAGAYFARLSADLGGEQFTAAKQFSVIR